ncbi:MAG: cation:proton antiporter [archaeon]|nr:cation:proton antiporter [archaeon]
MALEGIGSNLIFDLGVIVVFATMLALLGKFLKQPSILMYIIAGLIIGPIGLNLITDVSIPIISELGLACLLFAIGIQTDFSKIKSFGKFILIGSIVQVIVTAGFAFIGAELLGLGILASIYLGLILAFSSTAIVVKILTDKHEISTLHGKLLIGFLLVQDFLVVVALPLLENASSIFNPILLGEIALSGAALFALSIILARFVFPKFFAYIHGNEELVFLSSVSTCFIFIFASLTLGFSIAVGGFLAGLSLSPLIYNLELASKIAGLRDFFATIFFVSLGLQITFAFSLLQLSFILLLIGLMLFTVFVVKPAIILILGLFHGYGGRNSLLVGISLAQISEFGFILAAQALTSGSISQDVFSVIILVTALSMAISPFLINEANTIYSFFKHKMKINSTELRFFSKIKRLEETDEEIKDHIIVFGSGIIGSSIIKSLNQKYPMIAVDNNPEVVLMHKENGVQAVLGDASNYELMRKINLKQSKLVVSAIPDIIKSEFVIKKVKEFNPSVVVFGRARKHEDALRLYNAGADYVIMPEVIAGNEFVKNISYYLETGKSKDLDNLKSIYLSYLKRIEEDAAKVKKFEF